MAGCSTGRRPRSERSAGIQRGTSDTARRRPAVRVFMAQRGTAVLAPLPAPHNRGLYTKEDLEIDLRAKPCPCTNDAQGRPLLKMTRDLSGYRLGTSGACPLRAHFTARSRDG